jgi:hypothetical protein
MPITVLEEYIPVLAWPRGEKGTVWFLQPRLHVSRTHPFQHRAPPATPTPFQLLRAAYDHEMARPLETGPVFFLLPEFALAPGDCASLRDLLRGSPARFIFVAGVGQLQRDQALNIDGRAELWDVPSPDTYTNCALVAFGGYDHLYLQPKIVPSGPERDHHWAGRAVRYFHGDRLSFAVLICSEFYAQPDDETTLRQVLDALDASQRKLRLLIWIQHNRKPRSDAFSRSIQQLSELSATTTAFLVCSRADPPGRLDNYAVSGALVPHDSLPARFCDLDRRFHYVEPIPGAHHARVVLLRYDADAYRVRTTLADTLHAASGVAKIALFQAASPYLLDGPTLRESLESLHLRDLSGRALGIACRIDDRLLALTNVVREELVALETPKFLRLLDLSALPASAAEHAPGRDPHEPAYLCRCWPHRDCLDRLTADDETALPLANLIWALATLRAEGLAYTLLPKPEEPITCAVDIGESSVPLRLLDSGHTTFEGVRDRLSPSALLWSPAVFVLLGSAPAPARLSASRVDAAVADPVGSLRPTSHRPPVPAALSRSEFLEAHAARRLGPRFRERWNSTQARGA